MPAEYTAFEKRKQDHITLALMPENQADQLNTFDQINLYHEALPDLNFAEINITSQRFGKTITNPFMVSSMTAGHTDAIRINHNFMSACAARGWAMGVGSQRRELTDPDAFLAWAPLKKEFPQVSLFGNLGIAQLITTPLSKLQKLVDALSAKSMIIHCNPLQECIQPAGTPNFKGCLKALEILVKSLNVPVIVKETGCGFSRATLKRLNDIGVAAVDISGAGGTHWGRIEGHRATQDPILHQASQTFSNWGLNTISSLISAKELDPTFEIWGSGGVRNGLDAAKLFALGASTVGFAKALLSEALIDSQNVLDKMASIEYELKVAMFCTGSARLTDLKDKVCR